MKVLLLRDVKRLGSAGDIKTVANGYAANYLLPRGLAVAATPGVVKDYEERRQVETRKREYVTESAEEQAEVLSKVVLSFTARAGEKGKLYGSITSGDIAAGLEMETGQPFDRRKVLLDKPIRELGTHRVPIKLMSNLVPEITVVVEAEGGTEDS